MGMRLEALVSSVHGFLFVTPQSPESLRSEVSGFSLAPFSQITRGRAGNTGKEMYVRLSPQRTARAVLVTTWNPHGTEQGRAHSGHPGEFSEWNKRRTSSLKLTGVSRIRKKCIDLKTTNLNYEFIF